MSKTQLRVLWVGIAVFVLMGLFPPEEHYHGPPRFDFLGEGGLGSRFISNVDIDFSRLFVQWAIVAIITGGFIYSLKVDPELILKIRCRILSWLPDNQPYEELLKSEREKRKPRQNGPPPESPAK